MLFAIPVYLREGDAVREDREMLVEASDRIMAQAVVKRWIHGLDISGRLRFNVGHPHGGTGTPDLREADYPLVGLAERKRQLASQIAGLRKDHNA